MKITSLEIERFGLWSGLTLPELSDGINVFYGANEAGKSTLLEFIRAALYGFGNDRQRFTRIPDKTHQPRNTDSHVERTPCVISGYSFAPAKRAFELYLHQNLNPMLS